MLSDDLSVEAKYTDKESYSLKARDLIAAEKIALLDGRDPVFVVEFSKYGRSYAIVPWNDYLILRGTDHA